LSILAIEFKNMMFDVDLETLRKSMQGSTPVSFSYFKKDGTCRSAVGTLHEGLIPSEMKPKDSSVNHGDNFRYYDLEKKGWRSLHKDCSLVTIIE
jgi:hypothetical protein